jgi:hypothetical protein
MVQLFFGQREVHPTQGVEKIMQAIACGHALGVMNELLVGLSFRQCRLGGKVHRASRCGLFLLKSSQGVIARLKNWHTLFCLQAQRLSDIAPSLQPWR